VPLGPLTNALRIGHAGDVGRQLLPEGFLEELRDIEPAARQLARPGPLRTLLGKSPCSRHYVNDALLAGPRPTRDPANRDQGGQCVVTKTVRPPLSLISASNFTVCVP
jgi:hypothetical protein